jgi:hypothetical protein
MYTYNIYCENCMNLVTFSDYFSILKKSEQITRILYDLVAFAFDSYTLKYYGIYNHRTHDIKFV